jgi:CotS family spore coat protein
VNAVSLRSEIELAYGINILRLIKVRDVYRIVTKNDGVLCLKSYEIPESEMHFIARVFTHLIGSGFKYSPKILLTLNQASWITRNGVHYMLTNWVMGEQPDFSKRNHYKKAVRLLAKFHSVAQGIPGPDIPEGRIRYNKIPELIASYRKTLSENANMGHHIGLCDEALEHLTHPTVLQAIEKEQSVFAIVHGDYNFPNLVRDKSRSTHMIDFENTSLNVRMQDFSHILHRNFPWQSKETLQWIDYYNRKRPLSKEDLHLLHALLLVPYPVIRALRLKKKIHTNSIILPTLKQIRRYRKGLKQLL